MRGMAFYTPSRDTERRSHTDRISLRASVFAEACCLIRCGSRGSTAGCSPTTVGRVPASYVDRILRGEKPGDLPVQFPTKFEMVVNRKTAKALGLAIPPSILLRADEVIE